MSWEITWVFIVAGLAMALFVTERVRIDLVALSVPIMLLLGGAITPEQALSGLSNEATVTVAAVLVLGLALQKTGAVDVIGRWAQRAPLGGPRLRVIILCALAGVASGFLNNTAVVAVMIPVFIGFCDASGHPRSRALIPLSFAAILGGTLTLIGTSTNLIVHGMAKNRGLTELDMFSITPVGAVYLAIGLAYLWLAGRFLLPSRETQRDLADRYDIRSYDTELAVPDEGDVIDHTVTELGWEDAYDVEIHAIVRDGARGPLHPRHTTLMPGDRLIVNGDSDAILKLADAAGLRTPAERAAAEAAQDRTDAGDEHDAGDDDKSAIGAEGGLVEVMVAPGSSLVGHSLRQLRFRQQHDVVVLGIQHHGRTVPRRIGRARLAAGDLLLLQGSDVALEALADHPGLIPLGARTPPRMPRRAWLAVAILAAVIIAASVGVTSILVAAMVGVVTMLMTRCLTLDDLYADLDWSVIALLAGLMPLGLALDETGGAKLIAEGVGDLLSGTSPMVAIAVFYLFASLLTEIMSNAAAAVVLTPIALEAAGPIGLNPYAMLVAVMFGCSASFMTPMGYQTNAMVYAPGGYRFSDYVRAGVPLNLILVVVAAVMIPILWPLEGG